MRRGPVAGVVLALATASLLTTPAATAATPDPSRTTEQAIAASVVDLAGTVVDLAVTVESADGALVDTETVDARTLTLSADVLFAFGRADLAPAAVGRVAEVAAAVRGSAGGSVRVVGYTDSVGDPAPNLALSQRRAEAVRAALASQLPGRQFEVQGRGEADPVARNTTPSGDDDPAGRAKNRRVVVTVAGG